MAQPEQDHLTLRIVSQPRYLCAVRAMIDSIAERLGFDDATRGTMILAVDEALTNVIRHGYDNADDKPIWIKINPLDGDRGIRIVIEDECPQIDPARLTGRDLADVKPGGLGVHIMKQVMDAVTIEPREGSLGMRLSMTKSNQHLADQRRSG